MMKRVHLFEIEDQLWFPSFLRDYMTDFLQFLSNKAEVYRAVVPLVREKLKESKQHTIVDLASGGGGGLRWLNETLQKDLPNLKIILTDYYPNIDAFELTQKSSDNFQFVRDSIDARDVPESLKGFRTQFLSFHHFKPSDAEQILQNAIDANSPIAIFEAQDRSVGSFVGMLLSPIVLLFLTPFIKPFKMSRILFTYLIPILPLCILWDGIISCFRTYSVEEMQQIIDRLKNAKSFHWEVGKKTEKNSKILFLVGLPKN
ncbi:MAG: class I SAM-dependent methyltransferase [Bacteroidota bacterium]